jgi:hypothetical protein
MSGGKIFPALLGVPSCGTPSSRPASGGGLQLRPAVFGGTHESLHMRMSFCRYLRPTTLPRVYSPSIARRGARLCRLTYGRSGPDIAGCFPVQVCPEIDQTIYNPIVLNVCLDVRHLRGIFDITPTSSLLVPNPAFQLRRPPNYDFPYGASQNLRFRVKRQASWTVWNPCRSRDSLPGSGQNACRAKPWMQRASFGQAVRARW